MKSIICFSVVIIISSLLIFIGSVNSARGNTRGRSNAIASLCNNTSGIDSSFLTKATGCVNSTMSTQIKTGLATCLKNLNKNPQNPTDILAVLCDKSLFGQVQQCLRTQLQQSNVSARDANNQVRTAVTKFTKCIQQ